jgi:hypothetical protein
MKRMIGVVYLCMTIPVVAMELQITKGKKKRETVPLLITPDENEKFLSYVKGRLGFGNTVTMVNYVPKDNPIYTMLYMLSVNFLKDCNNNVLELIKIQGLQERINNYQRKADSSRIVKFCLKQINTKEGDVNKAQTVVAENRQIIAEQELQKIQPKYSYDYIGAFQTQDRINYMKRNADYPTDENAVKDFIALLIYQVIFAHQTHQK